MIWTQLLYSHIAFTTQQMEHAVSHKNIKIKSIWANHNPNQNDFHFKNINNQPRLLGIHTNFTLCWRHEFNLLQIHTENTLILEESPCLSCYTRETSIPTPKGGDTIMCNIYLHREGLSRTASGPYPIPACRVTAICCVWGPCKPNHIRLWPPHSHDQKT